ncbi:MAG TPA: hypothetical protein VHX37_04625 [Acidobacteriaceae bacterium]|nr:hypothetical protein [Acidobacteriaceae bacterium]
MTGAIRPAAKPITLQTARFIWVAFLFAACAFIWISLIVRPRPQPAPPVALSWAFAAIGAVDIVLIGAIRRKVLAQSQERSMRGDSDAAQAAWSVAQLLGFAAALSIVLFGFVLSIMGASPPWTSVAFYIAGLLILLGYRPRPLETR